MQKKLILILFSLITCCSIAQQQVSVDKSDTINCNELIRLSEKHKASNPYASAYYAEKAIRLGQRKGQLDAVVRGNLLLGMLLEEKNNTADAYRYYQNAIKIAVDIKDSSLISQCYRSIGVIYKRLELFEKSIDYLTKALKYAENSKQDMRQLIGCRNVIGHVYMDWFDKTKNKTYFDSAIKSYNSAIELCRANKKHQALSHGYANLANAYMLRYKNFNDPGDIKRSLAYSYEGLNFSIRMNHPEDWTTIHYTNIGEANYYFGNNDSALIYFNKTLALHKKLNNEGWYETIHRDMANAYRAKGDYDNAVKNIREAIDDGMKYHAAATPEDYRILSELYSLQKNYIGAFDAYKRYKEAENIEINSKRTLQLEKLQIEYESNLKDREIEYLNQKKKVIEEKLSKNRLFFFLIITSLALVILVCFFLILHSRNLKRSKELSDSARVMQEQFLANTSHEIRTPMNGIQGMVNLLLESPLNSSQRQQLETIKTSSNHLLRIINDLLDLSKIKAGKIEFVNNTFEIGTIVNLIRELLLPLAENKGLSLNVTIDPSASGYFTGDDIRLEQILINLVSNAIKYTEVGSINLEVVAKDLVPGEKKLWFKISDSGIGIPKRKQSVIFDSFVQLENAGRRKHGGAGLGLSITKQLVELQKGAITVNSSPGEGSEFVFWIPYKVAAASVTREENLNPAEKRDLKGKRILVIEDNEINQKVISNTLRSWNAEAMIVSSAVEGFDLLINLEFDLILMDIELPVINGWDATQYIRMKYDAPKKNIPVIALTAYASEDDRNRCFNSGMNDVVLKPFNSEELYTKICNLIFHPNKIVKQNFNTGNNKEGSFAELERKYKEDKAGLIEIYNLFLSELPVYVEELKALNEIENLEGIKKQAHKMKSPIGLIGSVHLLDQLNRLQQKEVLENKKKRRELIEFVTNETAILQKEISDRLAGIS